MNPFIEKSSKVLSAPPLHVVSNTSQANSAEQGNFQKSSLKCFEID